jgi:hypothetical protein
MVRRTKPRRSKPRRDKGGGVSPPSRGNPTDWEQVGERVNVSYTVLGHPQQAEKPVEEGVHYEVLAYTDWADQFIPTVVKWSNGEVDDFTSVEKSVENMDQARLRDLRLKRIKGETGGEPVVKKMFNRFDVPYYGLYDPERDMWLHGDGHWSKPYPERGRLWYAVTEEAAQRKLEEYMSGMSRIVKPPGDALPVGGSTLMVGSKEYAWRTSDRDYRAAQEKAGEIRKQGNKAVIRKEQVSGKPAYVVYARREDNQ